MVSGYQKWVDKPNVEGSDKTKLRQLGIQITTDPKEVDILIAPKILRTRKFVCALASAPLVVGTDYLDTALAKGKLKQNPSMLLDREAEEKFGFKLEDSLKRAEENKHQLLKGWHIFVTKAIAGGFETYKDIIDVNGGSPYLWSGRTGMTIHKGVDGDEHAYLVCGESSEEVKLRKQFRDQAAKAHLKPRILSSNWLLNLAMSQEVTFQPAWDLQ
nr:brct-containing protein 1 [Quercus suber]